MSSDYENAARVQPGELLVIDNLPDIHDPLTDIVGKALHALGINVVLRGESSAGRSSGEGS